MPRAWPTGLCECSGQSGSWAWLGRGLRGAPAWRTNRTSVHGWCGHCSRAGATARRSACGPERSCFCSLTRLTLACLGGTGGTTQRASRRRCSERPAGAQFPPHTDHTSGASRDWIRSCMTAYQNYCCPCQTCTGGERVFKDQQPEQGSRSCLALPHSRTHKANQVQRAAKQDEQALQEAHHPGRLGRIVVRGASGEHPTSSLSRREARQADPHCAHSSSARNRPATLSTPRPVPRPPQPPRTEQVRIRSPSLMATPRPAKSTPS